MRWMCVGKATEMKVWLLILLAVVGSWGQDSKGFVSALVNAALGKLKAGNTLKFNVNIENPQAIIDEAEALKGSDVSERDRSIGQ